MAKAAKAAKDSMLKCEVRRLYKVETQKQWRWVEVDVAKVGDTEDVRCVYCHGKVRVHRQKVEHGPQDHAEHRSREDSENCQGGHYFKGTHTMSGKPVE